MGGQLPLDFFVIGESTPVLVMNMGAGGAFLSSYFLRRAGFSRISFAATGEHPSFRKTSSP